MIGWWRWNQSLVALCTRWRSPEMEKRISGESVGGEEIPGRGQRCQSSGDVGQQREIGQTLDVRFQLFADLSDPGQFLLVLLQQDDQKETTAPYLYQPVMSYRCYYTQYYYKTSLGDVNQNDQESSLVRSG